MKTYLTNAFSLGMLDASRAPTLKTQYLSLGEAKNFLSSNDWKSVIGHGDTAMLLTNLLGVPAAFNRESVSIEEGDTLLVAQYKGPRLPERTTNLPDGATFQFVLVTVA